MLHSIRLCGRVIGILVWTLLCAPVQLCMLALPGHASERFARLYWRGIRRFLGMRITVIGTIATVRPVLFVVNHSSWLDVVALGSVLPACFVAKNEIEGWPVFNVIARLGRTIFVSRLRTGVQREQNDMQARLAKGDNLILFPEGTTSDGSRILRFQSAFLAVAQTNPAPYVQPVTLVYDRIDGLPVRRVDRPLLSWYGSMNMASHFPAVARLRSFHATLILDAVIPPGAYPNRKILSGMLEARLAENAAALRQGRNVVPAAEDPSLRAPCDTRTTH